MSKKIIKNHIGGTPLVPEYNVSKIRAMTDKEAKKRAENDQESPIVDLKFAKRVKKLNQKIANVTKKSKLAI